MCFILRRLPKLISSWLHRTCTQSCQPDRRRENGRPRWAWRKASGISPQVSPGYGGNIPTLKGCRCRDKTGCRLAGQFRTQIGAMRQFHITSLRPCSFFPFYIPSLNAHFLDNMVNSPKEKAIWHLCLDRREIFRIFNNQYGIINCYINRNLQICIL